MPLLGPLCACLGAISLAPHHYCSPLYPVKCPPCHHLVQTTPPPTTMSSYRFRVKLTWQSLDQLPCMVLQLYWASGLVDSPLKLDWVTTFHLLSSSLFLLSFSSMFSLSHIYISLFYLLYHNILSKMWFCPETVCDLIPGSVGYFKDFIAD